MSSRRHRQVDRQTGGQTDRWTDRGMRLPVGLGAAQVDVLQGHSDELNYTFKAE